LRNASSHEEELRRREEAARASEGRSADPILAMVRRVLDAENVRGGLLDVGCGRGDLFWRLPATINSYTGLDLVRYDGFPDAPSARLQIADLNQPLWVPDAAADVVVSIETIEHLENPRALFRSIVGALRPGGLLIITTPNQLSVLSKLSFVLKNHHVAFQAVHYPAHITALLPSDLVNMGKEQKLEGAHIVYSDSGRIPGTAVQWPSGFRGALFSDNLAYVARRPA
jgi:2-polyprenyl-3-methyl-5-hydroxy-6-metoxy-1,4-benzoquinol methylase